jgi:hypothetical protein
VFEQKDNSATQADQTIRGGEKTQTDGEKEKAKPSEDRSRGRWKKGDVLGFYIKFLPNENETAMNDANTTFESIPAPVPSSDGSILNKKKRMKLRVTVNGCNIGVKDIADIEMDEGESIYPAISYIEYAFHTLAQTVLCSFFHICALGIKVAALTLVMNHFCMSYQAYYHSPYVINIQRVFVMSLHIHMQQI